MNRSILFLITLLSIALMSFANCLKEEFLDTVPEELIGTWIAEDVNITTREKTGFMKFEFYKGSGNIEIHIKEDGAVEGFIAEYHFKNGQVTNDGIFKIVIEGTGKLFPEDLTTNKEISFWIHEYSKNELYSELRLTQNNGKFPMASINMIKAQ